MMWLNPNLPRRKGVPCLDLGTFVYSELVFPSAFAASASDFSHSYHCEARTGASWETLLEVVATRRWRIETELDQTT